MATEHKLSYTASEIDEKLGMIDGLATKEQLNQLSSEVDGKQPKGDYLTAYRNITIENYSQINNIIYTDVTEDAVKHEGYFATGNVGATMGQTSSPAYTYFIYSVTAGETMRITGMSSKYVTCVFLMDSNNTILAKYPESSNDSLIVSYTTELVIPDGVSSVCVNQIANTSAQGGSVVYAKIEKGEEGSDIIYNVIERPWDWLYGKKLACVGDSITEASNPDGGFFKNYAEIVAERHNMTVYKDGKGGSTMANVDGHNPFCVTRYMNVPSDFDILTIWFGWNDGSYSDIGTIDSTEDTTFYGAYKKVLDYFITTYPTKKIGLIVPYGNSSVDPFRAAVRKLSEAYGVPCLDLVDGKQCSLIWGTANDAQLARRAALTYDTTHPNQAGHEYIATMYEAFIQRL